MCRIDRSICWPAVQRAATVLWLPPKSNMIRVHEDHHVWHSAGVEQYQLTIELVKSDNLHRPTNDQVHNPETQLLSYFMYLELMHPVLLAWRQNDLTVY